MSATRAKLAFCLIAMIWAYAFWPTLSGMLDTYLNSGYDYQGLIVVPMVFALIWYKRAALHRITISCNQYGLLLVLMFSALWLFAVITKLNLLEQASVICLLLSLIFMSFGAKITCILYLPLLSLFLLLPIGQYLYVEVQNLFSWLLVKGLSLTKLAIYWEKDNVHVASKSYIISDSLKGLQYLMLYLTFAIAYAFIQAKKWYQGLIIAASFIVIPFVFILASLFILISINHWFDIKVFAVEHFTILSWLFTSAGLVVALILGHNVGTKNNQKTAFNDIDWRSGSCRIRWLVLISTCLILLGMPILATMLEDKSHYAATNTLMTEPGKIPSWNGPVSIKGNTVNSKLLEYNKNKKIVLLSLINNNNSHDNLYDTRKWRKIIEHDHLIDVAKLKIPAIELVLKNSNQSKIIWTIYYVNGHLTNSKIIKNVLERIYSLSKNGTETGIIAISTDVTTELGAGRELLSSFLLDLKSTKTINWMK